MISLVAAACWDCWEVGIRVNFGNTCLLFAFTAVVVVVVMDNHVIEEVSEHNLERFTFPPTEDGDYARRFLAPLIAGPISDRIANIPATLRLLCVDSLVILPITLTVAGAGRDPDHPSYVASPLAHYVLYGSEELHKVFSSPLSLYVAQMACAPLGWLLKLGRLDSVVYVNNWLLSTNLYPHGLTPSIVAAVVDYLVQAYPDRTVVWRSVDQRGNPGLYNSLVAAKGGLPVFSRVVFYQDTQSDKGWDRIRRKRAFKSDRSLMRRAEEAYDVQVVEDPESEISPADRARMLELYQMLYLEQYTYFNPQFTLAYLEHGLDNRLFQFVVVRSKRSGVIDAMIGFFTRNGVLTTPIFGYDTSLPRSLGLYRILSRMVTVSGRERGLLTNCSGGVGDFKKQRGGEFVVEYNVVFAQSWLRMIVWWIIAFIGKHITIPVIRHYDL